jgi:putative ABC transport system permease protein
MTFADSFDSAIRAIAANKLRSVLTMLGVVIGVGSVIAMIGIGEGTKRKSLENIEIMGSNMILVMPDWRRGSSSMGSGAAGTYLDTQDVERLKREVETINLISGVVRSSETVKVGNRNTRTQIQGCEPQLAIIRNATKMHSGSWFTVEDVAAMERKAVLGYQVYDTLFGGESAIGSTIRIKGQNFEVVGVVTYKGGSGMMNADDVVYIPITTAQQRLMGRTNLDQIAIQGMSTELLPYTQMRIEEVLARTHRNAAGENQFRIMNQGDWIQQSQTQSQLLSYLLAGIASVSLLVGGIGIMNIMLVSVTERTREIGLRKAIGAKSGGILTQFLLESIVMCVLGGAIGIGLGYVATRFVAQALMVPPAINWWAIALAFGFATLIGIFFGFYPAWRASNLDPIEALRHE